MDLICNHIKLTVLLECKTEKRNSQCEHGQPIRENKRLDLHVCLVWLSGSLSITTPVLLLANEFDVRSVLHRKVSLAAVCQIYVFHEAMNSCKNLKIHYPLAFKLLILSL